MLILIDKTTLRMVAAAGSRKWINLVSYVDFPNIESVIVDGMEGKTWASLTREQMATLYTNMSGQPAPEYTEAIKQLSAYAETWPQYPKSESELEVEAEKIWQAEQNDPEMQLRAEETAIAQQRQAHQATIDAVEMANSRLSPEDRAAAAAAQPKPAEKAAQGEEYARPRQGQTKRIWEIADDLLAVTGSIGNIKEFRRTVIERAEAQGLNGGTAATQFGHWKRSKGIN